MSRWIVRTEADLAAIERDGLDAFLPHASPFALIEASARHWPQQTAIRYVTRVGQPETDIAVSYDALARRIRQAANLFRRLGVGPDDAVAILAPHTLATEIALWAAQVAGRACPINPMLPSEHVVSLIAASGAKIAIVLGENGDLPLWPRLVPALRASKRLSAILHCDADEPTAGSDGCFEDLLNQETADTLDFALSGDDDAIAACFHTGGTTGAPKLALHTRRNEAFVGRAASVMYDLGPGDILINGFPLFHVAGAFVYGLSVLAAGGTILIPTRLGLRNQAFVTSIWRQVAHYGVTVIGGVPTVMSALMAVPVDADLATLRMMLTGGSPLPTELADAFERAVGKPVRNILGMTECAGIVTIEPFHGPRVSGSTGLRLPFTEVHAFAATATPADLARPCAPGATGVLALRGPNVSPGYSDAGRNAGTFDHGWLISGDLGHVDADGRVHVTGRAKDVIIRGAHNIDPGLIEDALLQHPAVAIAAAIGRPDAYAGELPVAYVTLRPGTGVDPDELRRFVARHLEPAAQPKAVAVLTEMPLTPIGKIYKPALRLLATREAITDALAQRGLQADDFALDVTEAGLALRLRHAGHEAGARAALLGMPINYTLHVG
ncbi:acyl-CoA synthetase [Bradyrhizobium sp. SSBR45G]|uniref:AMP-binding protein n=1 Tax=unclassified Bradyrhizobium TaxID=2631580 RepID=UPI002342B2A2|nr:MULTISPECIES: AMP-binding protein [unclassified Bradyrhizobium]GLH78449.1 acyl-CoA synthetase [Bradyrhizobium sp. SSBR45G]GLH86232.1 acyl-CoA synthetase [Bradyrhizobium sp. SSBR45R]